MYELALIREIKKMKQLDWIETYKPNVEIDKAAKPKKAGRLWSIYRDKKSIGHKTRNGVGLVGQIREHKNSS